MRNFIVYLGLAYVGGTLYGQTPALRKLSLDEAIQLGLKNNLSALQADTNNRLARIDRIRSLAALLPTVNASAGETVEELNLATFGFHFPGVPSIIGPFAYSDVRANAAMNLIDLSARKDLNWVCERVTWVSSPRPASRRRWISVVPWACRSREC